MNKSHVCATTIFAAALLSCSAVSAKPGFYVEANVGVANSDYDHTAFNNGDVKVDGDLDTDVGPSLTGAAGYDFEPFRAELGINIFYNGGDKVRVATTSVNSDADLTSVAVMANGYFDYHNSSKFTPYLGAGLGYVAMDSHNKYSTEGGFGYQGILGVKYMLNDCMSLTADYRYLHADDAVIKVDATATKLEFDQETHLFNLGINYKF